MKIQRALISVSDKTGIIDFARSLVEEFGIEIISTGGTAEELVRNGIPVTQVSEYTGFPEIMNGRVKTLHPKIHGGLLKVRTGENHAMIADHTAAGVKHGIKDIDMVVVNLYPFEQTIAKPDVTLEEAIENIDIGGPSMLRSGAKNYSSVTVVPDPSYYEQVLEEMRTNEGDTTREYRAKLATRTFDITAKYDRAIAEYLWEKEKT